MKEHDERKRQKNRSKPQRMRPHARTNVLVVMIQAQGSRQTNIGSLALPRYYAQFRRQMILPDGDHPTWVPDHGVEDDNRGISRCIVHARTRPTQPLLYRSDRGETSAHTTHVRTHGSNGNCVAETYSRWGAESGDGSRWRGMAGRTSSEAVRRARGRRCCHLSIRASAPTRRTPLGARQSAISFCTVFFLQAHCKPKHSCSIDMLLSKQIPATYSSGSIMPPSASCSQLACISCDKDRKANSATWMQRVRHR